MRAVAAGHAGTSGCECLTCTIDTTFVGGTCISVVALGTACYGVRSTTRDGITVIIRAGIAVVTRIGGSDTLPFGIAFVLYGTWIAVIALGPLRQ